jgi:AraC-like DNA-binding protein
MQISFQWDTFLEDIIGLYPNDSQLINNNLISQLHVQARSLTGFVKKTKQVQNVEAVIGVFESKSAIELLFENKNKNWFYKILVMGKGVLEKDKTHYDLPRYFFMNPEFGKISVNIQANQEITLVVIRVEHQIYSSLLFEKKIDEDFLQTPNYLTGQIESLIKALNNFKTDFISIIEAQQNILQLFLTIFNEEKKVLKVRKVDDKSFSNLQKVVEILTKNYSSPEKPNIQKLADFINVSPSKLKSDFKSVYQESIYSYYLKRKLEYAVTLLGSQKYTVSQVAIKVGYQAQATKFVQIFRKYYGVTPKQFQIQNRNITNQET